MSTPFDRQAPCPSCGAPVTFRFAQAQAVVCSHCKAVVARTDRDLRAVGRVADLAEIPSPLAYGAFGRWGNEPFVIDGRVQLDRASAPGAPWQEFFVAFPTSHRWAWLAYAQGRWYSTSEVPCPPSAIPPPGSLAPGRSFAFGGVTYNVVEVGQRRVVSAEGGLPHVAAPGVPTGYVDFAGPNGAFGTIDYGSGAAIPPRVYLGRQIDITELRLESGQPAAQLAEAPVTSVQCPSCGASLPIASPSTTERVVCRYCGTASDFSQGALRALGTAPKPPMEPLLPLGAKGSLRGEELLCIGFVIRGCTVEGERYRWREYLLYGGPKAGYLWLMEEDGAFSLVRNVSAGDVMVSGTQASLRGTPYSFKQSVYATVEHVVGEFYWKVEAGEGAQATEYEGPGGKLSVEETGSEVTHSFCEPVPESEVRQAFGLAKPPGANASGCVATGCTVLFVLFVLFLVLGAALSECDSAGGDSDSDPDKSMGSSDTSGSSGGSGAGWTPRPSYGGGK